MATDKDLTDLIVHSFLISVQLYHYDLYLKWILDL